MASVAARAKSEIVCSTIFPDIALAEGDNLLAVTTTDLAGNVTQAVGKRWVDAARAGEGPGLIEALTYRIGGHSSSDDPTKYRAEDELQRWTARDPPSTATWPPTPSR